MEKGLELLTFTLLKELGNKEKDTDLILKIREREQKYTDAIKIITKDFKGLAETSAMKRPF